MLWEGSHGPKADSVSLTRQMCTLPPCGWWKWWIHYVSVNQETYRRKEGKTWKGRKQQSVMFSDVQRVGWEDLTATICSVLQANVLRVSIAEQPDLTGYSVKLWHNCSFPLVWVTKVFSVVLSWAGNVIWIFHHMLDHISCWILAEQALDGATDRLRASMLMEFWDREKSNYIKD